MDSSGKVLTIFLVITGILLITLTAISLFFFQREIDRRKLAEATLEEYRTEKATIEEELQKAKKQNFLLTEKNKEADERIDDLSDELELEKGLREEMKIEGAALKEQMEAAVAAKETLAQEIKAKTALQERLAADLAVSEKKIKDLETELKAEADRRQKAEQLSAQQQAPEPEKTSGDVGRDSGAKTAEAILDSGVELEEIVVVPGDAVRERRSIDAVRVSPEKPVTVLDKDLEGRILSVDTETEFVIVNLGKKDGIEVGNILSVYHGDDYAGDIKITRLQPEMSAADLIPPFSIGNVQRNDQVKAR